MSSLSRRGEVPLGLLGLALAVVLVGLVGLALWTNARTAQRAEQTAQRERAPAAVDIGLLAAPSPDSTAPAAGADEDAVETGATIGLARPVAPRSATRDPEPAEAAPARSARAAATAPRRSAPRSAPRVDQRSALAQLERESTGNPAGSAASVGAAPARAATRSVRLRFRPGAVTLHASDRAQLDRLARAARDGGAHVDVTVEGGADGRNDARARAIQAALVARGVPGARISARAASGPTDDVAAGSTVVLRSRAALR